MRVSTSRRTCECREAKEEAEEAEAEEAEVVVEAGLRQAPSSHPPKMRQGSESKRMRRRVGRGGVGGVGGGGRERNIQMHVGDTPG